jgi:ribosomal protein S18 acetylase RimI-like enzyme
MPAASDGLAVAPQIRRATQDDAEGIAEVQVRAWQAAYVGLMPQLYLDSLDGAQRAEMWRRAAQPRDRGGVIVAVSTIRIAGFAAFGREEVDGVQVGDRGQLYALNVHPERWRTGLGSALLSAVQAQLAAAGYAEAVLWVHPENLRAIEFYRRHGWADDGARQVADALGVTVPEIRYRRLLRP